MDDNAENLFATLTGDLQRAAADNPNIFELWTDPPKFEIALGWILWVAITPQKGDDQAATMLLLADGAPVDPAALSSALCARIAAATEESVLRPVAEVLGLPEVVQALEPIPADHARREESLAVMVDRFDPVAAHVARVFGLRVPRHLAVFAAFWHSLTRLERRGMELLGFSPAGLTTYFLGWDRDLAPRDGLDERLNQRYWCDPPEFITVMSGNSDGQHFGLWYDDPRDLPAFVAGCYARDDPSIWTHGTPTLLAEVRHGLDRQAEEMKANDEHRRLFQWPMHALSQAVAGFAAAEAAAVASDGVPRWQDAPRQSIGGGTGPALPPGSGDTRSARWPYDANERSDAFAAGSPEADEWVATARRELAAGQPAFALVLGRELYQCDREEQRDLALDLLTAAYRALGRDALADLAVVHQANRDLANTDILRPAVA
jgi:hypothetical protein